MSAVREAVVADVSRDRGLLFADAERHLQRGEARLELVEPLFGLASISRLGLCGVDNIDHRQLPCRRVRRSATAANSSAA